MDRPGRASARLGFALVLLGAVLCATPAPVVADPWGTGTSTTGAHPDGGVHSYCFEYGFSQHDDATAIENASLGDPTAATVLWEQFCDYSSSSETDVVWQMRDLSGTKRGSTYCEDYGTHCDQFYVQIDYNEIVRSSDPDRENVLKTMCHELGHSVGLSHGSTYGGCMVSGPVSGAVTWRRYDVHHRIHINNWFGA